MKDILNRQGLKCILFYLEGCEACDQTKLEFPKIISKYPKVYFDMIKLDETSISIYKNYITDKEPIRDWARHDDGEIILDASGKPLETYVRNIDGTIKMDTPIIVPNFFIFYKEDETDGFLGNVAGYNLTQVENILTTLENGQINE